MCIAERIMARIIMRDAYHPLYGIRQAGPLSLLLSIMLLIWPRLREDVQSLVCFSSYLYITLHVV